MVTMNAVDKMMKDAQEAREHGALEIKGDESLQVTGVTVSPEGRLTSIYHRETGEKRTMSVRLARVALTKKFRSGPMAGEFAFSTTPTRPYHMGQVKCQLHPDNPGREQYDKWGLPVCKSEHLASPGEMRLHMEKRHTSAWKTISEAEEAAKRQEGLDAQKALAEAMLEAVRGKASAPPYVKEPKK